MLLSDEKYSFIITNYIASYPQLVPIKSSM